MEADGILNLRLQSAYRSYQHQQGLFEGKVSALRGLGYSETEARAIAAKTVAVPGTSEHQTGLAVDVSINGKLNAEFGDTEAGIWLKNNSDKYGYIVRYPKEKIDITRIIYEPWHLRYVGIPHAQYMQEHHLCFEEYIDHVKAAGIILFWIDDGNYYKMSYDADMKNQADGICLDVSSISADEAGGYIVTEIKRFMR